MSSSGFFVTPYGASIIKDPQDEKYYSIIFADQLSTGATIASVDWDVPAGLTEGASAINSSTVTRKGRTYAVGTIAQVFISGGTSGTRYTVTCHATCSNAEKLDASFIVDVRDR